MTNLLKSQVSYTMKCSCHSPKASTSEDSFDKAWKAIEDGEISTLKQAIQEMKKSEAGSSASLDTCHLKEKSGVAYSMSLLALCGIHGREDMVDLLLDEGADMNAKCACEIHTGTPVFQMMLHCLIQHECDKLSVTMLEYFIQKGAELSGKIATRHFGIYRNDCGGVSYGMLDLPLSMQRIDCAKVLVKAGVDLISGGCPVGLEFAVVPMFQEYRDHGTNEFICWAFNEYIPKHPEIDLKRIIQSIINMKKKDEQFYLWQSVRRSPTHALLTSHHEATIKRLVECGIDEFDGLNLLNEQSCTGKTALHVAAEDNDVESVHILLQLGADTRASDNSGMNPFMVAVEKDNLEAVKAMVKKDPGLMSFSVCSQSTAIHWALEEGHQRSVFFKVCFEEDPEALLTVKDSKGNTIAHLVAASGNTEVFEMLWSKEFAEAVFSDRNLEDKTPLQLAVENGHINVLKTFETRIYGERECTTPRWHHNLKNEWWNKIVPYVLYASACGSLRAVEYFIASGQEPTISHKGKTPLLCAAKAGHDEIVTYLLQFREVQTYLKYQPEVVKNANASPLLMAAQNGHTKCVTLLLQNGANVLQRDSEERNGLMLAIQNHHKDTALAILSEKDGLTALNRSKIPTPLHLLVKEMPDLAEYVLNKCITQPHPERQISISGENFVENNPTVTADQPVHYNFEHLEGKDAPISNKDNGNHILLWMVKYDRLKLLQHPLVGNFILRKNLIMAFPLFILHLLFYCTLLVTLNWFALVVPRPGPDSETCPESTVVFLNGPSYECKGQSGSDQRFLAAAATALYFLSCIGVVVEAVHFRMIGWKYFHDSDNYFRLALYSSIVNFIYGFDNECWCSTHWQWQIGAFAVFLSWLNFIFILKHMPHTAIPINMFLSICVTFLKLIFLPIVLILAFGVPFYMVFVRTTSSSEEVGHLSAFRSPTHALAKTLLQLVGEFDFEATFNQGALLYTPTAYILFVTFLITMPLLFTNLLIGLAVGDTEQERQKAEFTKLKAWVEFSLEQETGGRILRQLHRIDKTVYYSKSNEMSSPFLKRTGNSYFEQLLGSLWHFMFKWFEMDHAYCAEIAKKLKQRNDEIYSAVMSHNPVDDAKEELKEDISNLRQEVMVPNLTDAIRDEMTELKEDITTEMMAHTKAVEDVREDMTKLKEDISNLKQEMANLVQALMSKMETTAGFN